MNNLEQALLEQMDGQEYKQFCTACKKETVFVCHKSGIATCNECAAEAKIDLTELIEKLKAMGVSAE